MSITSNDLRILLEYMEALEEVQGNATAYVAEGSIGVGNGEDHIGTLNWDNNAECWLAQTA